MRRGGGWWRKVPCSAGMFLWGTGAIMTGCSSCRRQWHLSDSNPWPAGYKPSALTTQPRHILSSSTQLNWCTEKTHSRDQLENVKLIYLRSATVNTPNPSNTQQFISKTNLSKSVFIHLYKMFTKETFVSPFQDLRYFLWPHLSSKLQHRHVTKINND